jgi:hypothetical protein
MSSFIRRIVGLGPSVGNLVVSAVGGFIFMRGIRLIAMEQEGLDAGLSMRSDDRSPKTSAEIDATIFLLAFVASAAMATIDALHH